MPKNLNNIFVVLSTRFIFGMAAFQIKTGFPIISMLQHRSTVISKSV